MEYNEGRKNMKTMRGGRGIRIIIEESNRQAR